MVAVTMSPVGGSSSPSSPPCSAAALHLSVSGGRAMNLNSCRQEIELAAATKVSPRGSSLSIRQCLLEAGFSTSQASNKTMQARVRREVQRLTHGREKRAVYDGRISVPLEIVIPTPSSLSPSGGGTAAGLADFLDGPISDDIFDDDDISVLTDPTYLPMAPARSPPTPHPEQPLPSSSFVAPAPSKPMFGSTNIYDISQQDPTSSSSPVIVRGNLRLGTGGLGGVTVSDWTTTMMLPPPSSSSPAAANARDQLWGGLSSPFQQLLASPDPMRTSMMVVPVSLMADCR